MLETLSHRTRQSDGGRLWPPHASTHGCVPAVTLIHAHTKETVIQRNLLLSTLISKERNVDTEFFKTDFGKYDFAKQKQGLLN